MSIEIDWAKLTTGDDGLALAESIRDFIHDKFQRVALPGFIRTVEVHSFEFGSACPSIVVKDVCDPLPDFYEDSDSENSEDSDAGHAHHENDGDLPTPYASQTLPPPAPPSGQGAGTSNTSRAPRPPPVATHNLPPFAIPAHTGGFASQLTSPLLSRSSTPGIPGGTSNMASYFHLPLSARLPGASTPSMLATMARPQGGERADYHAPPFEQYPRQGGSHATRHSPPEAQHGQHGHGEDYISYGDPSTRPSTAHSLGEGQAGLAEYTTTSTNDNQHTPEARSIDPDPSDLQVVLHVAYAGDVRMSLTAEILLDYPMPSFVGIPLKLNITGLSFDGVALLAYLRRRAHFCFLGKEDAEMLVGAESKLDLGEEEEEEQEEQGRGGETKGRRAGQDDIGGLLREIRVESEIGQKEGGKQVLKNVGKVEKFVLEQVRRIFEEEMVWPSFWTFLV